MNRTDIINEYAANATAFRKVALNIAGEQDAEDLYQEVSLMILEFTEERLISYYNPRQGLKPIYIRMLCNQYRSKTSKFHKEYRKQEQFIQSNQDSILLNEPQSQYGQEPEFFDKVKEACENIYNEAGGSVVADLEQTIWELYVETGSLRKTLAAIPEEYQKLFDLKTVHEIVKKFRRTIKEHLNTY